MQETDARSFEDLALHARIVQEELRTAQGSGYIVGPNSRYDNPKLPGFPDDPGRLGTGSGTKGVGWRDAERAFDHIRFLEQAVERLSAQVAELAERLAGA